MQYDMAIFCLLLFSIWQVLFSFQENLELEQIFVKRKSLPLNPQALAKNSRSLNLLPCFQYFHKLEIIYTFVCVS